MGGSVGSACGVGSGSAGGGSATAAAASLAAAAAWRAGENCRPRAVGGGGGCPLFDGDFWKTRGNLSTCGGTVYHQNMQKIKNKLYWDLVVSCGLQLSDTIFFFSKKKKSKINRIQIRIYFRAENKSVGEDLFLDTK